MLNKKHRRTVGPLDIRKRSEYTQLYTDKVGIPGTRVPCSTGYRVSSFNNRSFETFYEVMLVSTSTNRYLHKKKDKVIWVLAGQGFLQFQAPGEEPVTKRLIPGDHVAILRGSSFMITTTSQQTLEMLVTQQARYEDNLEVIEEIETTRAATLADMTEPGVSDRTRSVLEVGSRRGSKAAQQQVADRSARGRCGGGHRPLTKPKSGGEVNCAGFSAGTNVMPSGGKLSAEGAG